MPEVKRMLDPNMENAIRAAGIAIQNAGIFSAKTMRYKMPAFARCGVLYFENVMLAELSKEVLCLILDSVENDDILTMNNIILGLAMIDALPESISQRVLLITGKFASSSDRTLLSRIMNSFTYEEVVEVCASEMPLPKYAIRILLYSPDIGVKNPVLNKILCKYLVTLSQNRTYTFGSRMNVLYKNQSIINEVFSDACPDDIDINFAIAVTMSRSVEDCNWLKNIFYFICSAIDSDSILTKRISLIYGLYGSSPFRNALERSLPMLLQNQYLHRAFIANRGCKESGLFIPEIDDDDIYEIFKSFVMQSKDSDLSWRDMVNAFGDSLKVAGIYTFNDISLASFGRQADYYRTRFQDKRVVAHMEQNILSGHRSPDVDTKHYVDNDIRNMLESVHGIIIGDVDIRGKILKTLPNDVATDENAVSSRCGYCGQKTCNDFSYLDCLMCKDFVTTPDRLPYFKEKIKSLDRKIMNTAIPHDKEDLVAIKRLHVGFIEAILNLEKGEFQ